MTRRTILRGLVAAAAGSVLSRWPFVGPTVEVAPARSINDGFVRHDPCVVAELDIDREMGRLPNYVMGVDMACLDMSWATWALYAVNPDGSFEQVTPC